MGMMGRLTERDKELIGKAIRGIAENDIGMIQEAVMALGEFKEKPDQSVLYEDISELMSKYGSLDMGEIDVAEVMMDLMEVMKENKIRMPHGLTMLARGLSYLSDHSIFRNGRSYGRMGNTGEKEHLRTDRTGNRNAV